MTYHSEPTHSCDGCLHLLASAANLRRWGRRFHWCDLHVTPLARCALYRSREQQAERALSTLYPIR
jgi:hypothetical protein